MVLSAPRVGIVIRTKDRPLFVPRALNTVLGQVFDGWHVVLVNDGGDVDRLTSALALAGLEAPFGDGRMQALHPPQSVGRSEAFNIGARALETELICCLDDDDTWHPEFLAELIALHDRTKALAPDLGGVAALVTALREDIVATDGVEVLEPLGEDYLPVAFQRSDFFLNPLAYATYRHDLYPVQWMLNRENVLAVGGFPPDFNVMEDRAFMTRFLERWRLAICDRKLAFHHRRVRRSGDTSREVSLNTLDNPSYDWRLYSDLARMAVNSPDPGATAATASLQRALAATMLKEMNDETSALWHKINGESAGLRAHLDRLAPPVPGLHTPASQRLWSVWDAVGSGEIGFRLGAGVPFLDRLSLSMAETPPGLALHGDQSRRRLGVQVPRTQDWCALEVSLDGLASGQALRVELIISIHEGALLESALSLTLRDRLGRRTHRLDEVHVHACPPGGTLHLQRWFTATDLAAGEAPKLSIALPRHAQNLRLWVHELVIGTMG